VATRKILDYLKAREGQEVSYEELLAAHAIHRASLDTELSKLVAGNYGVTRIGPRQRGERRPYRYDTPAPAPEPVYIRLRVAGQGTSGNLLARDDEGTIYEILPIGRLDRTAT
jgi:hypothetical protein